MLLISLNLFLLFVSTENFGSLPVAKDPTRLFDFHLRLFNGQTLIMHQYEGAVSCLIFIDDHSASLSQLTELQDLENKYESRGFRAFALAVNDVGAWKNIKDPQLESKLRKKFKFKFPLLLEAPKNDYRYKDLITFLTGSGPARTKGPIKESFTKFILSRSGRVIERLPEKERPTSKKFLDLIHSQITGLSKAN